MSLFVDTCVFFAAYSKNDIHHVEATGLLEWALLGTGGAIYTSDYVFDETVTLARFRTHDNEIPLKLGWNIRDSSRIIILRVDEEVFDTAWDIFNKYCDKGLSFTDCTSVALINRHKIDRVMSFDAHFDGIVERIEKV